MSDNIYMSEKFTSLPGSEKSDNISSQNAAVGARSHQKHRHQRHKRLAATHVALQQTVHLQARVGVVADFAQNTLLRVGQAERQMVVIEVVKALAYNFELVAAVGSCAYLFES